MLKKNAGVYLDLLFVQNMAYGLAGEFFNCLGVIKTDEAGTHQFVGCKYFAGFCNDEKSTFHELDCLHI